MTRDQRERMIELCSKMQVEQDSHKLLELVEELDRLLGPEQELIPLRNRVESPERRAT
jgi:hypothetical protein